jgi:alanyl-tRNA synthetase
MISQQIRGNFLHFFKEKRHSIVPSSPVLPAGDPTLLFINAGMNQFKDVFLGKSVRDYTTAASAQKCIRVGGKHNDLDNVGHTSRHLTFFEMLGNFSFGEYFKKNAIAYAWELTLRVFEFDPQRLWATVFHEDEESFELWKSYLPEERIVRMGEKDNFWAMGDTGPCGPCSEL